MSWFVYIIPDPVSGHPVYVGTTKDVTRRARDHITRENSAVKSFVHEAKERGLDPQICPIVELNNAADAQQLEDSLIALLPGILNKRAGGYSGAGGRPAKYPDKPWLTEGVSKATWYRRQKEKRDE